MYHCICLDGGAPCEELLAGGRERASIYRLPRPSAGDGSQRTSRFLVCWRVWLAFRFCAALRCCLLLERHGVRERGRSPPFMYVFIVTIPCLVGGREFHLPGVRTSLLHQVPKRHSRLGRHPCGLQARTCRGLCNLVLGLAAREQFAVLQRR